MQLRLITYSLTICLLTGIVACDKKGSNGGDTNASTPVQTTSTDVASADRPVMTFEESSYDFGTIAEGDTVVHKFVFINTGKTPLIVHNATAQCGCTVPEPPKEPVAPGEKGEIKVVFNSKGKPGPASKAVTITANTEPSVNQVVLKGIVNAAHSETQGSVQAK
jgi:hypothetical protein